jgi:hypothetical protein
MVLEGCKVDGKEVRYRNRNLEVLQEHLVRVARILREVRGMTGELSEWRGRC